MKIKLHSIIKDYNRKNEPYKTKNKMYVWVEDETLLENLMNRRNRPYQMYKKEVIPVVMELIKKKHPDFYNEVKDSKWSWNRKCGCGMCPCSPGFVSDITGFFTIQVEIK